MMGTRRWPPPPLGSRALPLLVTILCFYFSISKKTQVEALVATNNNNNRNIKYRTAKTSDFSAIAKLLTDTFETTTPSWNFIQSKIIQNKYKKQLEKRMNLLVRAGAQHALIVAVIEDDEQDDDNNSNIAGFMELGTMPSPIPVVTTIWQGIDVETRPERPYLANLAVNPKFRRQSIGTKLVKLALKLSEKWCDESETASDRAMFLSVEKDNQAAIDFYFYLKFNQILDETERLTSNQQRKLRRQPKIYFQKRLPSS